MAEPAPAPEPFPLPGLSPDEQPAERRPRVLCADCHRPLTAHDARLWGRGPGCRRKHGLGAAPRIGRFDVEQDRLPGT
ncbi:DUF6011 domain-containing protein [Streptomyces sp. NPDC026673]|uniref:DUF6011 domain-containing protein n=1 Tax=Streptomyces sp. NPDC026673 TaxID=3155724 RepID=UPI0033DAC530